MWVKFLFFAAISISTVTAYYTMVYYYCEEELLGWYNGKISSTSSLPGRGPDNARIESLNAWTAGSNALDESLQIDLGMIKNISKITTRGRSHSREFVREYTISFGYNGRDYSEYKENDGSAKLFKGNTDGDSFHTNKFATPIIAQYIRINPTRWRDRISLRVELFGCDYVSETLHFNGTALVYKNLTWFPVQSRRDEIKFRFKTTDANGILLYSRGTQGDFIALQIVENRMLLNMNLGSNLMTSVSAGSLLDDSIWHDVYIVRDLNYVRFIVDRVEVKAKVKGDFQRLDLDALLYIGGVPNIQEGLIIAKNFTGCVENFYLNHTNVIHNLKNPPWEEWERFYKYQTIHQCPESQIIPITFLNQKSFVRLVGYEGIPNLNVTFEFRSYEEHGLLVYHKFTSDGYFKLLMDRGKLIIELQTEDTPRLLLDNFAETLNDGLWHRVVFTVSRNNIKLIIDDRMVQTTRLLKIITGNIYIFGGGVQETAGFVGCMRQLSIDGNFRQPLDWKVDEDYCCKESLLFDACQMIDRCNPNPCEHGGICKQSSSEFECDCSETGYSGAVCHSSLHPISCQAYRNTNAANQRSEITIDPDGSGPLTNFTVTCQYFRDGKTETHIRHKSEDPTLVDGFQEAGSFLQDIVYDGDLYQMEAVINRSANCKQYLKYECRNSRLFNTPYSTLTPLIGSQPINPGQGFISTVQEDQFNPMGWWVSRRNQPMDYWGDSLPGSRKCECGILGQCIVPDRWCNCDSGLDTWLSDEGHLNEMEYLPVRQLRFGDTGNPLDDKQGRFTLGPLICTGDALFDNVITFRLPDAALRFPRLEFGHSWDIHFEFKTTTQNAVILHSKGSTDYIKVAIIGGDQIQFHLESGSGPVTVNVETSNRLADNEWHSVLIESNRKQARIVIDGAIPAAANQNPGQIRAIELTSDLFIGSTTEYRDGYVGCIRGVLVNGIMLNLKEAAEKYTYGIGLGCQGKCDSAPCLNNGTCHEGYDGYNCDCRFTAFKGPICADEIGINMQSNSMVMFDFLGTYKSTIAEKFRVGFTTTEPKGFLMGLFSNISGEYLTLMVSNSGHLRLVFDFGFERQELIFTDQNFATGQYHDVQVSRMEGGTKLVMKVDNFEPRVFYFDVKASADAQFNNIQYLYLGKNESMREGFIGCISRVEFDDQYPLKYYFQENRPSNIRSYPADLVEDFCSVEPVTHPPELTEVRPPPDLDSDKLKRIYRNTESAILGGVLAVIFVGIVIMGVLIGRYLSQHKGEYLTQEDEGAAGAIDQNEAVIHGATGHHVTKKKEFFI